MFKRGFGLALILALVIAVLGITPAMAASKEPFHGTWTVSKVALVLKDATMSKKAQTAMVGKKITLAATSATAGTKKLANPNYQVSEMTSSDFEGSWGIQAKKVGLPAKIVMVEVYSGKGMTAEMWNQLGTIFVKSASGLLMHVDGVFFDLKK